MKRSFGVVLSHTVVLAFGSYLTHRAGDPPASATMSANVPQRIPGAEALVLGASSDEEAEASSAVAGSDRPAET
jgi:hypothetical protein